MIDDNLELIEQISTPWCKHNSYCSKAQLGSMTGSLLSSWLRCEIGNYMQVIGPPRPRVTHRQTVGWRHQTR